MKTVRPFFQALARRGGRGKYAHTATASSRSGSALIVALWVLLILSLLIGAFAFDMHIEAGITSFYRKRLRAQYLAIAGIEYAKLVMAQSFKVSEEFQDEDMEEDVYIRALNLSRGMGVSGISQELGEGRFSVDIMPEQGRRNVNTISDEDWNEVFDQSGVPQDKWDELIACFRDWVDADDDHRLLGAESDDPFYTRRGYECKNAPVDTVDELLLIKGFSHSLLYGGPSEFVEGETLTGIAGWLTVWGDGKVNVNTASREVLLTIPGLEDFDVDDILLERAGPDGELGTKDDGFKTVDEVISRLGITDPRVRERITTTERRYVRVVSIGESYGIRSGIWAVLQADESGVTPLFWREEAMP
jgi:general secretion pathway protein K